MKLTPVQSSNIKAIGYEDEKLFVEFVSGRLYRYDNVGEDIYTAMMAAQSKGTFLRREIIGVCDARGRLKYPSTLLEQQPATDA